MYNLYKRPYFHTFVTFDLVLYSTVILATNSASKQNLPFSSKLKFPYVGGSVVGFGVVVGFSVGEEVGFGAIVELGEIVDFAAAVDAFAVEVTTLLGVAGWLDFNDDVVCFPCVDARLWTDNILEFDWFGAVVDLDELVGEGVGDDIIPWLSPTRWIMFHSQQK